MHKKILAVLLVMIIGITMLTGCAGNNETGGVSSEQLSGGGSSETAITIKDKLKHSKIGLMSGSLVVPATEKLYPEAEILQFNDWGSVVEALKAGKVDYMIASVSSAKLYARNNKELCTIDANVLERSETRVAAAVRKGYDKLEEINEIIRRYLQDGTIDGIEENWINETAAYDKTIIPVNNDAPVLKIGVAAVFEPMCFIDGDGDFVGFDPELAMRIAYDLGMKAEFVNMDFSALIPALQSGKVDFIISDMGVTEERRQQVDFTERYFDNGNIVLARKTEENLAFAAAAANSKQSGDGKDETEQNFRNATIGALTGSKAIAGVEKYYPEAIVMEFDSLSSAVEAVKANKLDYVITSRSIAANFVKNNTGKLRIVEEKYLNQADTSAAAAVRKGYERLDEINEIITRYLNDGTMDKIIDNWVSETAANDTSIIPRNTDTPVWKVGIAANREPMCFVRGENEICGLDAELAERIAYDMGMHVEFVDMNFSALLPALESGKVDFAISNMGATEERRQIVDFTVPYFENPYVFLAASIDNINTGNSQEKVSESFIDSLKNSFIRTFITENRWKLVLSGLGVTILISLCSFVIGSLWGGVICALLRSKRKIANIPAKVYVRLLQGTPIVVLLMILYYIIFKDFDISAIVVAIIGFALNLGAYTSQIFKTAIDSVDKGQIEAASAMGFNKLQVFIKIIFPQAARNALPVYKGEFISLVKSTSIVGYIAIQDLTKVSDIIRSRTYEAFFPLIATAIIYFIVTYIFIVLLNVLEKKIDPKRRKRVVKGVETK